MKIQISRNALVREFYVRMEIGIQQNRGDIIAYTKLAQENGDILTVEELNQKFLGKPNKRIAIFLLDYCVEQNLFRWRDDENGVELTETGKKCADDQIFYERSSDIFQIQYLNEEYSEQKLLSCKRLSSREKRLPEDLEIIPVPSSLKNNLENNLFDIHSEDETESDDESIIKSIFIYALGEKCVELKSNQTVSISGSISEDTQLHEWITSNETLRWDRDDVDFPTMLKDILETPDAELHWSKKYDRLITQFPTPKNIQLSAATMGDVIQNNLKLKHYCPEQSVGIELKQCPLIPATAEDAKIWYYWLIEESIRDYLSESEYQNLVEEKLCHFDEFSEFVSSLEPPQRREFAAYVREKSDERNALYWHIMAPLDLSLEGIL